MGRQGSVGGSRRLAAASLAAAVALAAAGCGKDGASSGTIVARVGRGVVTAEQMDARLRSLPPQVAQQYEGEEGRRRFLEGFIEEEAWFQAALEAGMEKDDDVRRQLEEARRRVMIQSYFARELAPYTTMSDEDVRKEYEEHIADYTKPKEMKVRHVLTATRAEAEAVRRKLNEGADMAAVARDASIDEFTKKDGGLVGYVAVGAALVPYVGKAAELTAAIDTLPLMHISPVIESPRGFHVIRVEEVVPEAPFIFEKIKDTIRRNETPKFEARVRAERLEALKKKLGVEIVDAALDATEEARAKQAEMLFKQAQETEGWQARLDLYQEFLRRFPDNPHNYEAQFMLGFIYGEELKDYAKAHAEFTKLIERYPDCPLADDAKYMLQNLGGEGVPDAPSS
jgi:peptidyl-prolyl cis-trans isomerase C